MNNLIGKRFERLVVLNFAGKDSESRKWWLCQCDCGKVKSIRESHFNTDKDPRTKSCGCYNAEMAGKRLRRGSKSSRWKGGKIIDKDGYVTVYARGHSSADTRDRIREHRLVMSTFLGRPLLDCETVHHKNGIKGDNRLENLELYSHSHVPGQKVEDKVYWAKEILKLYEPSALKNA